MSPSAGRVCRKGEFPPLDELQETCRDLFLKGLEKSYQSGKLIFPDELQAIASPRDLANWVADLKSIEWVIRQRSVWDRRGSRDAEAAAKTVNYLARYANRVAISNSRLLAIEGDQVLFRYKDYRDGDQWKTASMPGVEFIRRFLLHVLPPGLRHIRRFGFMAPRVAAKKLELIRSLLGVKQPASEPEEPPQASDGEQDADEENPQETVGRCRQCDGGRRVIVGEVPRPTVAQLMKMPPTMERVVDNGLVQLRLQPLSALL